MRGGKAKYTLSPLRVRLNPAPVWAFLEEQGISQNELARQVGVSSGHLSRLINGRANPSPQLRRRLQRVLGVTDFYALFIAE